MRLNRQTCKCRHIDPPLNLVAIISAVPDPLRGSICLDCVMVPVTAVKVGALGRLSFQLLVCEPSGVDVTYGRTMDRLIRRRKRVLVC